MKHNEGKKESVLVNGVSYKRIPIKTHVIMPNDRWISVLDKYLFSELENKDVIVIAESVVATMQGRAIKLTEIQPRFLARLLSKFVKKNPGGIGLRNPEMMEMAIQEAGTLRILKATALSVLGKLIGKSGVFYEVAGADVRDIDGPDSYTIPPYNEYVVLAPKDPESLALEMSNHIGHQVLIVDVNDLGQNILGNSGGAISNKLAEEILADNPLGQSDEQTPLGIIRY